MKDYFYRLISVGFYYRNNQIHSRVDCPLYKLKHLSLLLMLIKHPYYIMMDLHGIKEGLPLYLKFLLLNKLLLQDELSLVPVS
ncbi:MAG: hypothetical protein EBR82_79400 [Caulobacteraceae bacterium]|nr:hypothetical protein [Caulobacteraceae bacterium]